MDPLQFVRSINFWHLFSSLLSLQQHTRAVAERSLILVLLRALPPPHPRARSATSPDAQSHHPLR